MGKSIGFIDRGGFDATVNTYATWNRAAFNSILAPGALAAAETAYTLALDEAALAGTYPAMAAIWGTTPVSVSHNPYQSITATGTATVEAETEALMGTLLASTTWPYGVIANNSIRANGLVYPPPLGPGPYADPHNANYTSMFSAMASYGRGQANPNLGFTLRTQPAPIEIQLATYAAMGATPASLIASINYAIWLGARGIELPNDTGGGYTNLSLGTLASFVPAILANDPAATRTPVLIGRFGERGRRTGVWS